MSLLDENHTLTSELEALKRALGAVAAAMIIGHGYDETRKNLHAILRQLSDHEIAALEAHMRNQDDPLVVSLLTERLKRQ